MDVSGKGKKPCCKLDAEMVETLEHAEVRLVGFGLAKKKKKKKK